MTGLSIALTFSSISKSAFDMRIVEVDPGTTKLALDFIVVALIVGGALMLDGFFFHSRSEAGSSVGVRISVGVSSSIGFGTWT